MPGPVSDSYDTKMKSIRLVSEEVRAILANRKSQLRRVIEPQPGWDGPYRVRDGVLQGQYQDRWADVVACGRLRCPYGVPGDRLWVRETWRPIRVQGGTSQGTISEHIQYRATLDRRDLMCTRACSGLSYVGHPDNYSRIFQNAGWWGPQGGSGRWRSSRYMPRWASRLILDVKRVRVQRLRDITAYDVEREGVLNGWRRFRDLWNSINAKRGFGWEANPWVWVVTFRQCKE